VHKKEHLTLKIRKPMELVMQEMRRNGILSSEWIEKHFPCLLAKLEDWERRVCLEALAVAVWFGKHKNHMGYDDNCACL
jgi:hypothetical protein